MEPAEAGYTNAFLILRLKNTPWEFHLLGSVLFDWTQNACRLSFMWHLNSQIYLLLPLG